MSLKSNGRNKFFNFSDGTSVRFTQDARSRRVWAFLYYRGEVVPFTLVQFHIRSWRMRLLKKIACAIVVKHYAGKRVYIKVDWKIKHQEISDE